MTGTRYCINPDSAWRQIGAAVFVYSADGAFHRLRTPTAVDLFGALVERPCEIAELTDLLVARYQVEPERACADATAFVGALVERKVAVEVADE